MENMSVMAIQAVHTNDTGLYVCKAQSKRSPTNGHERESITTKNVSLDILYPPKPPVLHFSTCSQSFSTQSLKVIKGQLINVSCTTTGNPDPTYSWHPQLYGSGNILILANINVHQTGIFSCVANNVMSRTYGEKVNGETLSSFKLDVLESPVVNHIPNQTLLLNTTLDIVCPYTDGNPPKTSLLWQRENVSLESMNREHLIIKHITKSDEGWYKSSVFNTMEITGCDVKEGVSDSSYYLDVQYAAKLKQFLVNGFDTFNTISVNESDRIEFIC
ncbi:hypothetical protein DPMN_140318 [Dreissena polymorpha]|uniref:Ig-like domain-containing protein n=1 Tax=Dreissena polymorpha TaxID=45954 RepID=A0A9D4GAN0_DREPO|nr:hypothetical protein DPMN_140318 [Dreissena polymorpha]